MTAADDAHRQALAWVLAERERQHVKGYVPQHDERHSRMEWGGLLLRYVTALVTPSTLLVPGGDVPTRSLLVKVAAVALAALEQVAHGNLEEYDGG